MKISYFAPLALALAACQGPGGPGEEYAAGAAPAAYAGKADGVSPCDELRARISALQARAEAGDRRAALQARALAGQLALLEREGACEPPRAPVPPGEKACAADLDGDGLLDMDELFGHGAPGAACDADDVIVRCPPRQVRPAAPAERVVHTGTAGRPTIPRFLPRDLLERFLEWVRSLGIHENEYEEDTYDCDDFAADLEEAIEDAGAEAGLPGVGTFTYVACDLVDGQYQEAHALTDVHLLGQIFWVEPQTAQIANLDSNGDGKVSFVTDLSSYPTPTEAHADPHKACFVAVFESADAAEAAGLVLD
ncbi:MAG: hypothetical protein H6706_18340 [Myxococcales bacterium]|nr:hypothetical protein [Myxococcales bacterium]